MPHQFASERPEFADREAAVEFLAAAFAAAGLKVPTGLSAVYRDDVGGDVRGVDIGGLGLYHVGELGRALFELAMRRGGMPATARSMWGVELGSPPGQHLEELGSMPGPAAKLPRGGRHSGPRTERIRGTCPASPGRRTGAAESAHCLRCLCYGLGGSDCGAAGDGKAALNHGRVDSDRAAGNRRSAKRNSSFWPAEAGLESRFSSRRCYRHGSPVDNNRCGN